MSESQTWISFLSTRNPALKMRPLAYCFIKTCLLAGPYSAFMSLFITGEILWTFSAIIFMCIVVFVANIVAAISYAKKGTLVSLFKSKKRWLVQAFASALGTFLLLSLRLLVAYM